MKTASDWKTALRAQLTAAMRAKEPVAVSVLRQLLSVVDQAGAVPARHGSGSVEAGPIAGAVSGLGAGDVARGEVSAEALLERLWRERTERLEAARTFDGLGRTDEATRLREEAALVARALEASGGAG